MVEEDVAGDLGVVGVIGVTLYASMLGFVGVMVIWLFSIRCFRKIPYVLRKGIPWTSPKTFFILFIFLFLSGILNHLVPSYSRKLLLNSDCIINDNRSAPALDNLCLVGY